LPTQATSNQMFGRVREFLGGRYAEEVVNLQLLHGHAALSAEFAVLRANAEALLEPAGVCGSAGYDGAPAGVVAAEWFTHRKRGLLAPFGVGTVDQALLAVLQTRHGFVRLFGLADKAVVIDEVHAYDAYMSTLLERLLEWLGALGASVALLSATLPTARRDALLAAYARGIGAAPPGSPPASYPRLSWVGAAGAGGQSVEAASSKVIRLRWVDGRVPEAGAPFALAERLKEALKHGGCAAVICNTVGRAQAVYRALKPHFDERELDLLHARFLYGERELREQRALRRFGKEGAAVETADGPVRVRRPDRAVLVATQVIEQSLDLDFDLMVTEPAPTDLVLQRAGRLHRHGRMRPAGLEEPTLWVCEPDKVEDGVPTFDGGTAAVYDSHVLLRSWLALKDRAAVDVPADVAGLVEAVYADERACPVEASAALRSHWEKTRDKHLEDIRNERLEAESRWVKPPSFGGAFWRMTADPREEDAPDFHRAHQALTRLTERTVSVVCLTDKEAAGLALRRRPSLRDAKALLRRSVSISSKRVVHELLALETPKGWSESSLLRHHRLIVLTAGSSEPVGKYRLRLEQDIGVEIVPMVEEET